MSITSLLGVARDAMLAQQAGVDVTGQNISNANTPGYVRRSVLLETRSSRGGPQGGVFAAGVLQSWDKFAHQRVVTESGNHGAATARSNALAAAEAVLAPGTGQTVSDKASAFFQAWTDLASKPDDPTARAAALARASDLAAAIGGAAVGLTALQGDLFKQSSGVASEVNERLGKIAKLNEQISTAQALGDNAPDLRDQRSRLVREVGERVEVKTIEEADGKITLLSSGSTLVDGVGASSLETGLDAATGKLQFKLHRTGGTTVDITSSVTTGTLGGIREARDADIPSLKDKLDQFAFDLANTVNTVHAAGFGLDGGTGRDLFTPPAAVAGAAYGFKVDPAIAGQPNMLAASTTAADLPGGNDTALAIAKLADAALGAFGGNPAEAFAQILGDVGVKKTAADADLTLRDATLTQANSLLESSSGVSLDEEMVNLTRYQRAFEASMRVVKVADELLAEIVNKL